MIKLIASDLDGTILLNGAQKVPEELFDLILELKKMEILFVAASGRQYTTMYRNFERIADEIGYISENGAVAYYNRELVYELDFDRALADELVREIIRKDHAEFLYSTREFYYVQPKSEWYRYMLTDVVKTDCRIIQSLDEIELPCVKMAVYEKGGSEKQVVRYWHERYADRCKVVTSGTDWVDFVPFGINKAVGVRKFMELLDIRPEECLTFGDEYNDVEMLQSVPYGFAMAHAKEGVRRQAPYTTESVIGFLKELIKAKGNIEEVIKDVQ